MKNTLLLFYLTITSALMAQPGTNDSTFNVGKGFDRIVKALVLQPDGKIIVGGEFRNFNGKECKGIVRLNKNGSLDASFNAKDFYSSVTASVDAIALQKDGKILIGGLFMDFKAVKGLYMDPIKGKVFNPGNMVRLNRNGSIDTTFKIGSGFDPSVYAIAVQPDGKIIVGGDFNYFNGKKCKHIVRLNPNGSIDTSFNVFGGFNETIFSIVLQSDNKIIVAGRLKYLDYEGKKLIQRLNSDGSLDSSFNIGSGFRVDVWKIGLTKDGKILASGGLNYKLKTFKPDSSFCLITCLNNDGSIDTNFKCISAKDLTLPVRERMRNQVFDIAIQPDKKILIAGDFASIEGQKYHGIARLNSDGSLDMTFSQLTNFSNYVKALLLLPNGKIIVAGEPDGFGIQNEKRKNISRLNGD